MIAEIHVAAINKAGIAAKISHASVELARKHHGADAFLRRNLVDGDPRRRLEADRAGVTARRQPLHEKGHILGRDAELVFKNAAGPQCGGLHVFRHADALALEVGGAAMPASLRTSIMVW